MKLVTTKKLIDDAFKKGRAVVAFNVNNMELVQAITSACEQLKVPVILQVTAGGKAYAGEVYIKKLVEAAVENMSVPVALHLDHGTTFEE